MAQPQQRYQRIEISTADPMRVVILLYEGAIKNLNQAHELFEAEDRKAASSKITRTQEIINYLRNALDHQQGGEIADNLERLYEYMRDTLNEANIKRDRDKLQEVVGLLQTLLEGWRAVIHPAHEEKGDPAQQKPAQPQNPGAGEPNNRFSMVG